MFFGVGSIVIVCVLYVVFGVLMMGGFYVMVVLNIGVVFGLVFGVFVFVDGVGFFVLFSVVVVFMVSVFLLLLVF